VRDLGDPGAVVDRRDAERGEPRDIGPAQLGAGRAAHRRDERGGRRVAQAWPRAVGDVDHGDRPRAEQRADEIRRLPSVPVRREPVVDRHHALVGHYVARDAAPDADGVQALVIPQPFHLGLPGGIGGQQVEDGARLVDRVTPHPGPRGVRPPARDGNLGAQRALAPSLDLAGRRLHQDREVAGQQFRARTGQAQQAVAFGSDLLAVVEDVRDVPDRRGQRGGQP
jgi:hypothetical protein